MKPTSTAAFTVIRYVVKPHRPEPTQFKDQREAQRAAEAAVRRYPVVRLYRVEGEPVTGLWRRPRLLATFGEVPDLAA
jgi:hypothetical protein